MKGLLKVVTGQRVDEVAALAAEIDGEKAKASEASAELDRLDEQRRQAPDFEAARAVDEAIARCRWQIEHADAVLPDLQRRLSALKAQRQAAAIVRHHKAAERAYQKLRVAIDAAAAAQAEAIAARNAAVADLGEGLAARLPSVVFMGYLLPDLVALWAAQMDRTFSGPPPKPKPVPPSPATIEKNLAHFRGKERTRENQFIVESLEDQLREVSPAGTVPSRAVNPSLADDTPPPRPKREPRHDSQAGKGERLITVLRTGLEWQGALLVAGDRIAVPAAQAESMVKAGSADFVTDSTAAEPA